MSLLGLYSAHHEPKIEIDQKKQPQAPKYILDGPLTKPLMPVNLKTAHDQNTIKPISKILSNLNQ